MIEQRSVALVGRPNVGKSRLFNRIADRRIAIVHDKPGVTRDVNTTEIDDDYTLMDTGGIGLVPDMDNKKLIDACEEQVFLAIQAATIICLIVDGREGRMPLDDMIVERLRSGGKKFILVINKIDSSDFENKTIEFSSLGIENTLSVSAEHGRGIDDLKKLILEKLGPAPKKSDEEKDYRVKITFTGKPNVGKSSICNRLLKSERLVVSEIPGTTRDSVEQNLDHQIDKDNKWLFRLIDTAGLRKNKKMNSSVEFFSSVRSQQAIENSDVVYLVIDALTGITKYDKLLSGNIIDAGKSIAVIVNKWDHALETFKREPLPGYEDINDFKEKFTKKIREMLFLLPESPVVYISALTGYAIEDILKIAKTLDITASQSIATSKLNRLINAMQQKSEPKFVKGKRFKIYYTVQTGIRPIRIRLFCNRAAKMDDTYRRYLLKGINSEFGLQGCPVKISLVGKQSRYSKNPKN